MVATWLPALLVAVSAAAAAAQPVSFSARTLDAVNAGDNKAVADIHGDPDIVTGDGNAAPNVFWPAARAGDSDGDGRTDVFGCDYIGHPPARIYLNRATAP